MGSLLRQSGQAAARDVYVEAGHQTRQVAGSGKRATVSIDELTAGPFTGTVEFSFYAGSRLMRIDAAVKTDKDRVAMFYDTGLVADEPSWKQLSLD